MAQVTYTKKRGTFTVAGVRWYPGQTLDVKAEVADEIRKDPDAMQYFIINGRQPAKIIPVSERPESTAPEDQVGNDFPAKGFKTKADAVKWAATYLPDVPVDVNRALKIITDELAEAYFRKVNPKAAREDAVLAGQITGTPDDGGTEGAVAV